MSKQNREQNRSERAAAIQAEAGRKERNRRLAITGGILVVLFAIIAAAFWATSGSSGAPAASSIPKDLAVAVDGNTLVVGPDDASTKVTVFEDFQCPYCKQFEAQSRDFLRTDAAEGKVQVTYEPINLLTQDDYSARALSAWAAILEDGTAKQALAFHDKLFDEQPYEQAGDKPDASTFQGWAKEIGVSSAVRSKMTGVNDGVVTAVNQAAQDVGLQGTPTVLVDGKVFGNGQSIDDLVASLEKTIAGA